jgi:hypothetical protein
VRPIWLDVSKMLSQPMMYSEGDCCGPILAARFAEDMGQMVRDSFLAQS